MEGYYYGTSRGGHHVPAFGSWDGGENMNLPFTQCFETARRGGGSGRHHGLLRYSYSEDTDLYVSAASGDLCDDTFVTPAVIVVPRRRPNKARYPHVSKDAEEKEHYWACEGKEPPSPPPPMPTSIPQAADEDLYKISPELLQPKPRKKRQSFFASCLIPTCDA